MWAQFSHTYLNSNASIILAMAVASLLPIIFATVAKRLGGFAAKDNSSPREFMQKVSGSAARAHAAQQNSYEGLPLFLAAVVVAMLCFVRVETIATLAWLYVMLRVVYGVAYVINWSTFRSLTWILGLACPLLLLYLAARLS